MKEKERNEGEMKGESLPSSWINLISYQETSIHWFSHSFHEFGWRTKVGRDLCGNGKAGGW
jgi:hypothetical protein